MLKKNQRTPGQDSVAHACTVDKAGTGVDEESGAIVAVYEDGSGRGKKDRRDCTFVKVLKKGSSQRGRKSSLSGAGIMESPRDNGNGHGEDEAGTISTACVSQGVCRRKPL